MATNQPTNPPQTLPTAIPQPQPQKPGQQRGISETSSASFDTSKQTIQKKTKFVVRKIPSFVTEDVIKTHINEFDGKYDWFSFCSQPDIPNPTRQNKQRYNRFYINFIKFEDAIPFINKFQKLEFFEKKQPVPKPKPIPDKKDDNPANQPGADNIPGLEPEPGIKACVEFAPNQSLPRKITTIDRRLNTIDADKDYLAFVKSLKEKEKENIARTKKATDSVIKRNKHLYKINMDDDDKDKNKDTPIAPLAKYLAQKKRKKIIRKNINRASLIRSERDKSRRKQSIREQRRRKRLALLKSKGSKYNKYSSKYQKKTWIAKKKKKDDGKGDKNIKKNDDNDDGAGSGHDDDDDDGGDDYYDIIVEKHQDKYYKKSYRYDYDYDYDYRYDDRRRGRGRGRRGRRGRGRRGRGRGRGRGRSRRRYDEPHFSGYASRRRGGGGHKWKAK